MLFILFLRKYRSQSWAAAGLDDRLPIICMRYNNKYVSVLCVAGCLSCVASPFWPVFHSLGALHDTETVNRTPSGFTSFYSLICISICVAWFAQRVDLGFFDAIPDKVLFCLPCNYIIRYFTLFVKYFYKFF